MTPQPTTQQASDRLARIKANLVQRLRKAGTEVSTGKAGADAGWLRSLLLHIITEA